MATDRDIAIGFLTRVLPAVGPYSLRYRTGKTFMRKEWVNTIDGLWDAMSQHGDVDCFYSTAAFRDETSPDAANVRAKRTFYLDLDGYKTQTDAIKAVIEFCQAVTLPWPGFVLSGHGVHAYWPLDADISPAVWLRYASGLKLACKEKELKADGAVTADPARILRCPGTFNCKKEPKTEVTIHDVFFTLGPYSLDEFAPLLSYATEVKGLPAAAPEAHFEGSAALNDQTAAYYGDALAAIPNDDSVPYDTWHRIGMAVFELGWGDVGRRMWHNWSMKAPKHSEVEFDKAWAGFPKYRETHLDNLVTPGSLIHLATEAGWSAPVGAAPSPPSIVSVPFVPPPELVEKAENGDRYELYRAAVLHRGPEKNDKGCFASNSYINACWSLFSLGVKGRYDEFTGQYDIKLPGKDWERKSEIHTFAARDLIIDMCSKSDPKKENVNEALSKLCTETGRYNSVRDYLRPLEWDGRNRIDTWLAYYLGASDTPLNRFYGATTLIAAVRRAMRDDYIPFDHMLILEGPQGVGKSTVVQTLGGRWFKNRAVNLQKSQEQLETFKGCWFYEWAELQGHSKADDNAIKTALSSPVDEARLAYRRDPEASIRRTILIGTTNETEDYLNDQTGARRYWCVLCGDKQFKLDELRRDRDQLFAEALAREKTHGVYLDPPAALRAQEVQEHIKRTSRPYLTDALSQVTGTFVEGGREWITTAEIKTSPWMANVTVGPWTDRYIAQGMKANGWSRDAYANRKDDRGMRVRRFWRELA